MKKLTLALTALMSVFAVAALAVTAPGNTDFGYELYDFLVNQVLGSGMGATLAVMALLAGGLMIMRQMLMTGIGTLLAGIFMLNADSALTAMGCTII